MDSSEKSGVFIKIVFFSGVELGGN